MDGQHHCSFLLTNRAIELTFDAYLEALDYLERYIWPFNLFSACPIIVCGGITEMQFRTVTLESAVTCRRCNQTMPVGTKCRYAGGQLYYHIKAECPAANGGSSEIRPAATTTDIRHDTSSSQHNQLGAKCPECPINDDPRQAIPPKDGCTAGTPREGPGTKCVSVVSMPTHTTEGKYRVAILFVNDNESDGVLTWRVATFVTPLMNDWNAAVRDAEEIAEKFDLPLWLMIRPSDELRVGLKRQNRRKTPEGT